MLFMKKLTSLGFLLIIIFSSLFADENLNEFENVFFTWQFYSYNRNNQNLNVFMDLNQDLFVKSNQSYDLDFNLKQNAFPQFKFFEPIGPVTSFIWLLFLPVALTDYYNDLQKYLIDNPRKINGNKLRRNGWEQWDREMEKEKRKEKESLQRIR
jgi:hypothetical protein